MTFLKKLAVVALASSAALHATSSFANDNTAINAELEKQYEMVLSQSQPNYSDKKLLVEKFYTELLKRNSDATGLNDWVNYINNGGCNVKTMQKVVLGFTDSAEFRQKMYEIATVYGNKTRDAELVIRVFKGALHRAPEKKAFIYYMNKLGQYPGWSTSKFVKSVTGSEEFKIKVETEFCS